SAPNPSQPSPVPAPGSVAAAPLPPVAGGRAVISWARLPGWDQEDHAAALDMFRTSCGVEKDAAWREVCLRARDLGPQDEVIAKAFWETNFRVRPVGEAGADEGLLTGYFAPE